MLIVTDRLPYTNGRDKYFIISIVPYIKAFNIFQVYQYFSIYRQYFFIKYEHFAWIYAMQHSLKLRGTN